MGTPSSKWYLHITDLPLRNFIDVSVDGNLAALTISGFPAQEDLLAAWQNIQVEYADAIGNHGHRMHSILYRDMSVLDTNIKSIECLVDVMQKVVSPSLQDIINEYGKRLNRLLLTQYKFDLKDQENYHANLKRCLMRKSGLKIDLDLKKIQYEALTKGADHPVFKLSREYFQNILITLSDYVKYAVQDNITVYEFCDRIRRFNKYYEEMESKKAR
ncbi:MAG TPA: hypothetical protein VMZ03_03880 [Chitinophagaceae bacterium]|nr:hypothetical protein [Chitinophagaceae bacterium]